MKKGLLVLRVALLICAGQVQASDDGQAQTRTTFWEHAKNENDSEYFDITRINSSMAVSDQWPLMGIIREKLHDTFESYMGNIRFDELKYIGLQLVVDANNYDDYVGVPVFTPDVHEFLLVCNEGSLDTFSHLIESAINQLLVDENNRPSFSTEEKAFIYLLCACFFFVGDGEELGFTKLINAVGEDSWTPLMKAAHHNWPGLASLLLLCKANVNIMNNVDKVRALDVVLEQHGEDSAMYKLLLEGDALRYPTQQ